MSTAPQSLPGLTLTPGVHPDLRIAADRHAQALAEAEDDLEVTPLERGMEGADAVLLAGPDAWQTLRHLRTAGCTLPVAVATDGPPPSDRPSLEPVLLLRRGQRVASVLDGLLATRPLGELALEGGVLDVQRGVFLRRDGASVRLSGLEWLLLTYLAARTDRPVSREELQLQVWDHRRPVPTRAVDMAISRTRKKIEPDPADPRSLITVRNVGYRLALATREDTPVDFVGRRTELAEIARLLEAGTVGVWGGPGLGKSRVTGVAAARVGQVVRVDLTGAVAPEAIVAALARAAHLDVEEPDAPRETLERLLGALPPRAVVIWDQADDAVGLLDLLGTVARRRMAIVRRARASGLPSVEIGPLTRGETAALLAERLGPEVDARPLLDLVDGVPLAAELAVGLVARFGVEPAAELLAGDAGPRLVPGLVRTVEASLAGLSPDALALLATLGRFRDGFRASEVGGLGPATAWVELLDAGLVATASDGRFRVLRAIARVAGAREPAEPVPFVALLGACARQRLASFDRLGEREAVEALATRQRDLETAWDLALAHRLAEPLEALTLALDRLRALQGWTEAARLEAVERARAACPAPSLAVLEGRLLARTDPTTALIALEAVAARDPVSARGQEAALEAVRILNMTTSHRVALARAMEVPDPDDVVLRLRLRCRALTLSDLAAVLSPEEAAGELASLAEELFQRGEVAAAIQAALGAGGRLRVVYPEQATQMLERGLGWAEHLASPLPQLDLRLPLADTLGLLGETRRALDHLQTARELARTLHPARAFQVRASEGAVLTHAGQHDAARLAFLEVLAWARRRRSDAALLHVHLWQVSLECDRGDTAEALLAGREALAIAERSGSPHHLAHAHLQLAMAARLAGDRELAALHLARLDGDRLSPLSRHAHAALRGDRVQGVRLARQARGALGRWLRATLADQAQPPPTAVDLRLVKALWEGVQRA